MPRRRLCTPQMCIRDRLEIESQLSDVQYQLENYTGQLRNMDQQVSYSTVDIYLQEVVTLTPTLSLIHIYIGAQALPLAARHWLAGVCAAAGLICVSLVKPVENG